MRTDMVVNVALGHYFGDNRQKY